MFAIKFHFFWVNPEIKVSVHCCEFFAEVLKHYSLRRLTQSGQKVNCIVSDRYLEMLLHLGYESLDIPAWGPFSHLGILK